MKKIVPFVCLAFLLLGCASTTYWSKLKAIDKAQETGKISSKEAFRLRNELYQESITTPVDE